MNSYNYFIPQNTAPSKARLIGIYNSDNDTVGQIPLGNLMQKATGEKLYSFVAMADIHVDDVAHPDANINFNAAMEYVGNNDDILFSCIAGDLVGDGTIKSQWETYRSVIHTHSNNKPVYAITGNHERDIYAGDFVKEYTGHTNFYTVHYNNDVFIFLNCIYYLHSSSTFPQCQYYPVEIMRSIYNIFERYRNKRCFVFQHVPVTKEFHHIDLNDVQRSYYLPLSLFQHYVNQVVFCGHKHYGVSYQKSDPAANVAKEIGFNSIHVPTLCNSAELFVIDVYNNGINIQTINVNNREIQPLGCFWIDTPLQTIDEGTYYIKKEQ